MSVIFSGAGSPPLQGAECGKTKGVAEAERGLSVKLAWKLIICHGVADGMLAAPSRKGDNLHTGVWCSMHCMCPMQAVRVACFTVPCRSYAAVDCAAPVVELDAKVLIRTSWVVAGRHDQTTCRGKQKAQHSRPAQSGGTAVTLYHIAAYAWSVHSQAWCACTPDQAPSPLPTPGPSLPPVSQLHVPLTVQLAAPDECAHCWCCHDGVLAHIHLLEAIACSKLDNDLGSLLAKVPAQDTVRAITTDLGLIWGSASLVVILTAQYCCCCAGLGMGLLPTPQCACVLSPKDNVCLTVDCTKLRLYCPADKTLILPVFFQSALTCAQTLHQKFFTGCPERAARTVSKTLAYR